MAGETVNCAVRVLQHENDHLDSFLSLNADEQSVSTEFQRGTGARGCADPHGATVLDRRPVIREIERSPERDAAVRAMLPHVAALGWVRPALTKGLRDLGEPPEAGEWLFPTGPFGTLEAWCDLSDRDMAAAVATDGLRVPQRIRSLLAVRLEQATPHKEAVRRALVVLAMPWTARVAARIAARTADAVWRAAGDRSEDLSWYTRRVTLVSLYGSVLAYWMGDSSSDSGPTLALLDRQLARLDRLQRRRAV